MASITSVPEGEAVATRGRAAAGRAWADRVFFGPSTQPRWVRPALLALLVATALLYSWNLTVSGWGNEYYAAAAQAGTRDWQALLFGSHDAGNAITVDKPPASLWVMSLSGRLLGFGSWSLLLPQALMGVGAVALLSATVRRWHGPGAALLAGAALAVTPVAVTMFRYDNPDALLTLLLVTAAYCTVRAIDSPNVLRHGTGWLALAGVAVGFAFLTKLLQAFLVLPALGAAFLVAAAGRFGARTAASATAGAAMLVAGGWYLLLVELWPADSRPYIGGSTNNSLWQLTLGYNGIGRLLGGNGNPTTHTPPPGGMGGAFGGDKGITRLFATGMGGEISWLLPAALIGLAAMLWISRRAPRTDRLRASAILWGGWLLVTGLVFSYMSGIIHPYYTVALAPAVAALVGVSVTELWRRRDRFAARAALATMSAVGGVWAFVLLNRTPEWMPWLRWALLVAALAAALAVALGAHRSRRVAVAIAAAGLLAGFAGSTAYAVETTTQAHHGGIPASGPFRPHERNGPGPAGNGNGNGNGNGVAGSRTNGTAAESGTEAPGAATAGTQPDGDPGPPPGPRGLPDSPELDALLRTTGNRWSAATVGSFAASALELRTGTAVIALGGFAGRDDSPTLGRFQQYVADGEVRYFVVPPENTRSSRHRASDTEPSAADRIADWVRGHFPARAVGEITVYDLAAPTA